MPYAALHGHDIYYQDGGHGEAVILLHGFPLSCEIWAPMREWLSETCRLVTPDLRGHGLSAKPVGQYVMDVLADDIVALAEHLGFERFVLGGHSMGGYVAFRFAARYADRLSGLILVDTRAEPDTDEGKAKRLAGIEKIRREGASAFLDGFVPGLLGETTKARHPALLGHVRRIALRVPDHVLAACLKGMMDRPDSRDLLPNLGIPVLIVVGEEDALTPPDSARQMARSLPDAELVVIPRAGHTPSLEAPDLTAKAIAHYLRRVSP
ncbi:MAG: alpha/beta fold hydrolase [Armatimonadota bacterium]|nr:alpha/beta fold hydrolase [Armatimonadota bacterium]